MKKKKSVVKSDKKENIKSCPKCAKINAVNASKCVSCGYVFNKKNNKRLLISLIISLLVMGVLALFVYFDVEIVKNNLKIVIYVLGGIGVFLTLYRTLFYGEKDLMAYSAEEKINRRELGKFKKVSIVIMIMGLFLLIGLGVYVALSFIGIK